MWPSGKRSDRDVPHQSKLHDRRAVMDISSDRARRRKLEEPAPLHYCTNSVSA